MDKRAYRRLALARRDALDPAAIAHKSARIQARVNRLAAFKNAGTVLAYAAVKSEVRTEHLLEAVLAAGKRLFLPVVEFGRRAMIACEIGSLSDLAPGPFGIPTPDAAHGAAVDADQIELVLVPGIAFDRRGHRLGYGAGYYDGFLGPLVGRARLVGLAFREQLFDYFPNEPHDVPVEIIVTDAGAFWPVGRPRTPGAGRPG